jgi:hypothetical protein
MGIMGKYGKSGDSLKILLAAQKTQIQRVSKMLYKDLP